MKAMFISRGTHNLKRLWNPQSSFHKLIHFHPNARKALNHNPLCCQVTMGLLWQLSHYSKGCAYARGGIPQQFMSLQRGPRLFISVPLAPDPDIKWVCKIVCWMNKSTFIECPLYVSYCRDSNEFRPYIRVGMTNTRQILTWTRKKYQIVIGVVKRIKIR